MPKISKETKLVGKVAKPKSLVEYLSGLATESFTLWQKRHIIPGTKWKAPIYQGPDPREHFHPRGLLKRYIGSVTAKTRLGKDYVTCGIPGATGRGSESDPDRAWIITQVLHRGWTNPKARTKPMRFAVWESELRNPNVKTKPPEGMEETPGVVWIFITFAKAQERVQLNPFHITVFESQFPKFLEILKKKMETAPVLRYRKVKFKK